jgi:signal transduction histidine kinase/ligand-binding sensor domain-containing protein
MHVRVRTAVRLRSVIRTLEACLLFALACSRGAAFESDRSIAQFAHTTWGAKEGAPRVIIRLAQSADGYLWLSSHDGLYRFDGVVFERYEPQSGGPFPGRIATSLLALPNGDLWIGFRPRGVSLLRNGKVTNYTTYDGASGGEVWSLAQDREGTMWAATSSGLMRLEGDRWKVVGKDWSFPGKLARTIFLNRQGTLWVSTEDTLVFLPPGARKFQRTGIEVGQVTQIAQAASKKLWMAETTRSVRPIPLSDKLQPSDETEIRVGSQGILFDNDGALWVATLGDGLRRSRAPELLRGQIKEFDTAVESFTAEDGLTDDVARSILQDREGNIWVGTDNGLNRFRKTNLVPVVGLALNPFYSFLAAGDGGDALVARQDLMVRIHRGRADRGHRIPGKIMSAYRDPSGAIWWLCPDAIYRYDSGNYTRVALPASFPKVYSEGGIVATEDGSGALWLTAEGQGLFFRTTRGWERPESPPECAKLNPSTAYTDWMGRAWFGYTDGTIILLKDGNIQRVFPADDSPVGQVHAVNGRGRHTWVGGESGLAFFDGNRFQRIVPSDAEAFGLIMRVEEAIDGSLWLAESRGAIQIPASEVRHALENPSYRVTYRMFDSYDGLSGAFGSYPSMIHGTDGRLWLGTTRGVFWIDPANISTNALPPSVLIRSASANGKQIGSLANLVLPPRTTALQIGYTALSLAVPEKVRFRYRLEGVDGDWQDAGIRREAFYTRLGPGRYHFQVIACNNDGVWNNEGAHLDFEVAPSWFQTIWFRTLCVVASFGLLWSLFQMRLRRVRHEFNVSLEARVSERTRIARDLHDTLLQSFNALLLRFQAASDLLSARPDEAKRVLDSTIDQAGQALIEGRDAVQQLRSTTPVTNDLVCAIGSLGQALAADGSNRDAPAFHIEVEGTPRDLLPVTRDEVYQIACEALRNAFRHARARRLEVEIRYDTRQLRLRIRDDGRGIDPQLLNADGPSGHYGLRGMRERARLLGGQLTIWSEVNSGTEIDLSIPSSAAYTKPAVARFWPTARRR